MEIQQILQTDMTSIFKWCFDNMMYINIEKTMCMTIGTRQKLSSQEMCLNLEIKSNVQTEKLLGVQIYPHLNRSKQIDQICSAISSHIYLLSKTKKIFTSSSKTIIL